MLEVSDLHAYFGKSHVLHGICLAVSEGELVSVLGRNGAGKSTSLKSIMGIVRQRSGRLSFLGMDLSPLETYRIARLGIAYVPDDRRIFSELTVLENLKIAAMGGSGWTLDSVIDLFPVLGSRRRLKGTSLSGGEQQMLAIARALMNNPRLILLDEPFQGLAPIVVQAISEIILEVKREQLGILLVEQNLQATLELGERHYVMDQGRIVFEGDAETFRRQDIGRKYLSV